MKYNKWILLFLSTVLCSDMVAQSLFDIEKLLEKNYVEELGEGYEEIVNSLLQLATSPLNLNTAGFDSLKMLLFLSDAQIDQILSFRKKQGNFVHLNELLWIPGVGKKDVENIALFVTLGDVSNRERIQIVQNRMKHETLLKLRTTQPRQEGYRFYSPTEFKNQEEYERKVSNRFQGPNVGSLIKYKLKYGNRWQVAIALENDPGEAYFSRYQKCGFDFCTAHFAMNSEKIVRQLIIGDYRVQWGQGLIAWGGFSSGKSDLAIGNEKSGKGFLASSSTNENNYLRGVAISLGWKNMVTDLFYSTKKTDANVVAIDTLPDEELVSVSLTETGYHRNDLEGTKKHALKEKTTGVSVHWNAPAFKVGTQAFYYDFSPSLISGDRIYQQYNDTGSKRWLFSVDYKTSWRGIYLFGEMARSDIGALAFIHGLRSNFSWLSACILYRWYDKKYVSHYASGFGEYSNTSNETGFYCGMDLNVLKHLKINLYYDWFRSFAPRYGSNFPGAGHEFFIQMNYQYKKWEHVLRYKYESRPEDLQGKQSVNRVKGDLRYQLNCVLNKCWEFRTRCNISHYHKDQLKEQGFLIYQDVIYTSPKSKLKMQYRMAWFYTDSYQSRIYAYENNVLYGYSFPSFVGKGFRTYLNLSWKPTKRWTCYLKGGYVIYPDRDFISSGVTKVEGNQLFDLILQFRFML